MKWMALALLSAATLAAQDPSSTASSRREPAPEFNVRSRLVLVPVSVQDSRHRPVDGLLPEDFVIYDNGQARRPAVDSFATGLAPIALVVAVQSSGISAAALEKVQKIGAMIQPLITGERGCAAVLSFDEEIEWKQECTGDPDVLARAFYSLKPGAPREARLLDAAHEAIGRLKNFANVRRVLLLISETRDRGSESELDGVVSAAQAAGVAVYSCTYSAFKTAFTTKAQTTEDSKEPALPRANRTEPLSAQGRVPIPQPEQRVDILGGLRELMRLGKTNDAEVLTDRTGGRTFSFTRQKGLEDAVAQLGAELHSQYILSFTPETASPGYHRLEVPITRSGKYSIRARPGYWATP